MLHTSRGGTGQDDAPKVVKPVMLGVACLSGAGPAGDWFEAIGSSPSSLPVRRDLAEVSSADLRTMRYCAGSAGLLESDREPKEYRISCRSVNENEDDEREPQSGDCQGQQTRSFHLAIGPSLFDILRLSGGGFAHEHEGKNRTSSPAGSCRRSARYGPLQLLLVLLLLLVLVLLLVLSASGARARLALQTTQQSTGKRSRRTLGDWTFVVRYSAVRTHRWRTLPTDRPW